MKGKKVFVSDKLALTPEKLDEMAIKLSDAYGKVFKLTIEAGSRLEAVILVAKKDALPDDAHRRLKNLRKMLRTFAKNVAGRGEAVVLDRWPSLSPAGAKLSNSLLGPDPDAGVAQQLPNRAGRPKYERFCNYFGSCASWLRAIAGPETAQAGQQAAAPTGGNAKDAATPSQDDLPIVLATSPGFGGSGQELKAVGQALTVDEVRSYFKGQALAAKDFAAAVEHFRSVFGVSADGKALISSHVAFNDIAKALASWDDPVRHVPSIDRTRHYYATRATLPNPVHAAYLFLAERVGGIRRHAGIEARPREALPDPRLRDLIAADELPGSRVYVCGKPQALAGVGHDALVAIDHEATLIIESCEHWHDSKPNDFADASAGQQAGPVATEQKESKADTKEQQAAARMVAVDEVVEATAEESRPMELTALADRIFKNPRMTRKLKSVYHDRLRKTGPKSWVMRLDGLPPNIRREIDKP